MKCEACDSKISVNYGNAYTVLCKNCSGKEVGLSELKKEKMVDDKIDKSSIMKVNKWVESLGILSSIIGILFMIVGLGQGNLSSLLSGVLIVTFGVAIYAFGNIIPYIVSIETNIRTLKDELVGRTKFPKDGQDL
ncbi:hypothetical protein SAMN05660297_01996 [Natronincola peptidivorans]|uniref:Uncharacterized protein n=1 Tax=Natronincola peptidivorans TaxID=426128 RepID=A0A1I0DDE1_9FIRM|nr:hypothetical protein [Natronincola peptidivorans]SET30362.1 hypothetical protein SAMN05660297_01996 [Natronincola peptidivorans]